MAGDRARLLKRAGFGGNEPLQMDWFCRRALRHANTDRVVFHESHDEAGNAGGTARTIVTAVNGAPLVGATRIAAEARSRVCFGLSLLSAGTPMFFMGEEIGAQKQYTFDNFLAEPRRHSRSSGLATARRSFAFYQDPHHSQPPAALDPQPQHRHPTPVERQSGHCFQAMERRRGGHYRSRASTTLPSPTAT